MISKESKILFQSLNTSISNGTVAQNTLANSPLKNVTVTLKNIPVWPSRQSKNIGISNGTVAENTLTPSPLMNDLVTFIEVYQSLSSRPTKHPSIAISMSSYSLQSKLLGHVCVSSSPQCWCTRFGDWTVINNFGRDKGSTRRKKTVFGLSVPTIFVWDCSS